MGPIDKHVSGGSSPVPSRIEPNVPIGRSHLGVAQEPEAIFGLRSTSGDGGRPVPDAGQLAIEGAQALRYNAYKIPLMRNLVKRAIRGNSDT